QVPALPGAELGAADLARKVWEAAEPATTHPYLTSRAIPGDGLRVGIWRNYRLAPDGTEERYEVRGTLIVPIRRERRALVSLQGIFAEPRMIDREARDCEFLAGGHHRGAWTPLGRPR